MRSLDWYQTQAHALMTRDANLRVMQMAMDRMAHLEYQLPEALRKLQWIRTFRSTAPYDALRGATRALSSLDEMLKLHPISVTKALPGGVDASSSYAKQKANEWETTLKWCLGKASERRAAFRADVIRSAVLYDEICAQVVHLPTQLKLTKMRGGNAKRYESALRLGDFAVLLRNPQYVHTRYSPYGLEAVLCVEIVTSRGLVDAWGDKASSVATELDNDNAPEHYVIFDWHDYDERCVFAIPGDDENVITSAKSDDTLTLLHKPNEYPFLPWVCIAGGTQLEANPEHQRLPLLYPIYRAELWITSNITGSMLASEAIAKMAQPDAKITGPGADSVEMDYTEPGNPVRLPIGTDYTGLDKAGLDPAKRELLDRFESAINVATVARVLVSAESQSGETFAGYNLRVQTAMGSLLPYKALGESFFTSVYKTMLYWAHYTKTPIKGYGESRGNYGTAYSIKPDEIDPNVIYLETKLQPDVPIDRLQKINGAVMMSRELKISTEKVLEYLDEPDPTGAMRMYELEQMRYAALQGRLQRIQAEVSGQLEQQAMQMAQQIVAQQMQAMQQQQAQSQTQAPQFGPPTGMEQAPNAPPEALGMEAVGGAGFNPNEGGLPPALMQPGATRETMMGRSRNGQELA